MNEVWIVVIVVGLASILLKAAGPAFLGGRRLSHELQSVVALIGPVMLTALVLTQTVGGDEEIRIDARLPGVAVAGLALWRGAPLVAAMAVAAVVTALLRLAS